MTTATQNWKFFVERDDVWDVRLFGGDTMDGCVGLQIGRWSLGIEALDDGAIGWSTPWRWAQSQRGIGSLSRALTGMSKSVHA